MSNSSQEKAFKERDETIGKTSQEELNNLERHETSSPDCREDPPPAGDETVGETSQEELVNDIERHDDVEPRQRDVER